MSRRYTHIGINSTDMVGGIFHKSTGPYKKKMFQRGDLFGTDLEADWTNLLLARIKNADQIFPLTVQLAGNSRSCFLFISRLNPRHRGRLFLPQLVRLILTD